MQVPDGRSVTTLVNATPIRSSMGDVESVVVTLQDMTPLEQQERQRAEFLGLVSHELRAPLTSIKGSAAAVLGAKSVLDAAEMHQFFRIIDGQADHMLGLISDLLDMARIEAGMLTVHPEPSDVTRLIDRARLIVLSGLGRPDLHVDLPLDLPRVHVRPGHASCRCSAICSPTRPVTRPSRQRSASRPKPSTPTWRSR